MICVFVYLDGREWGWILAGRIFPGKVAATVAIGKQLSFQGERNSEW
jgi:hypothetical protein